MKQKVIVAVGVTVLITVAYVVGHSRGEDYYAKRRSLSPEYWNQIAGLYKSFLSNVAARPSTLTSGTYMLETTFPGKPTEVHVLDLVFSDGKLLTKYQTVGPNLVTNGFTQEGKVVSGSLHDMNERPSREYIGHMDGNMMWGTVYVPPGEGWHEDEPPAYGVWRLYPKPEGPSVTNLDAPQSPAAPGQPMESEKE